MIWWIVGIVACYWMAVGGYAYRCLSGSMKRLSSYFRERPDVEQKYLPFYRTDFNSWDRKMIYRNCFLHFPWKFFMLLSAVMLAVALIYVIVGVEWVIKRRSKMLRKGFTLFMNYYGGKFVIHLICPTTETNLNKEVAPPEPIIISNHICWIEILYLVSAKWPISFLCKEEIERTTLVGTVATFGDSLYVTRENAENRELILNKIRERCAKVESGELPPLLIFPEGTTTNGNYLINFKRGAFEPMSRIKILGLKYECQNFNMAMDDMGQFCHLLLSLCQWPRLQIKILNDVKPVGTTADQYSDQARNQMAEILQVTQPNSRFRDKQLLHQLCVNEFKDEQSKQQK